MKKAPEHPITDAQATEFVALMKEWQRRLHLMSWRIVRGRRRPHNDIANVSIYPEHRMVRYEIGRQWGDDPGPNGVEEAVVHELMHVVLSPVIDATIKAGKYDETVIGEEHAVITVFEKMLTEMVSKIRALEGENAALRAAHKEA